MKPIKVFIWHRWWVYGWVAVCFIAWVSFIFLNWWWWVLAMMVGFLIPEIYAVRHEPSATPPLTSILRRYVRSWMAFPLLGVLVVTPVVYMTAGPWIALMSIPASATGFWCIEHFTSTYFQLKRKSRR